MDNFQIRSFTIEELLSLNPNSDELTYYEGCILDYFKGEPSHSIFSDPIRIDAYIICICTDGEISLNSNISHSYIGKNMMFVHKPENIFMVDRKVKSQPMRDIEMHVIAFSPEFVHKLNIDIKQMAPLMVTTHNTSNIKLSDIEVAIIKNTIDHARQAIQHLKHYKFYNDIIHRILEVLFYTIFDIISRYCNTLTDIKHSAKSRNEEYFSRFLKCLNENYRRERAVSFYAEQLHITPKYLTTVIRKVSGRSAAAWIDEYVILEAKNLLRYSTMSIQEVAYALNFPNQSFFGKYFKHHTSLSPSQYRVQR